MAMRPICAAQECRPQFQAARGNSLISQTRSSFRSTTVSIAEQHGVRDGGRRRARISVIRARRCARPLRAIDGSCTSSWKRPHAVLRLTVRCNIAVCWGIEAVGDVVETVVEEVAVLIKLSSSRTCV